MPSTQASAPASITQENGGNNGIEKAIAEEPSMMEILPKRQWYTCFRNRFGVFGERLRQNTASGEDELCQVVCLIV